jgi:glycosyltransferase involved in cell wall biosynthesis
MEGLSVVICCYNGDSRLPAALAHLKVQEPPPVSWELVLIDNASTDNTVEVAESCWKDGPVPLRVVYEEQHGTRYARERGLQEARYSLVGFVDDDTWVERDWVRTAYEIMSSDPKLGAVSSLRIPASEVRLPPWFDYYHGAYGTLTDQQLNLIPKPPTFLPTGGLCVRVEAWRELVDAGFCSQLAGRVREDFSGGEDTEFTIALRFRGWKLDINPNLRLQHFLPKRRLEWTYLRKLWRNCDPVVLDSYTESSLALNAGLRRLISDWWWYQFGRALIKLACRPAAVFAAIVSTAEGRQDIMEVERIFGRAMGLLRLKGRYTVARRTVRAASWRSRPPIP